MNRPLGPAFVVGAVRGGVAAVAPVMALATCLGNMITHPNRGAAAEPENLVFV